MGWQKLLLGSDFDESIYALADKSRPDPWITAADFAARSIADLGTKDHHLLDGLGDDDHPQYPALAQAENISGLWQFSNVGQLNIAGDVDIAKTLAVGANASPGSALVAGQDYNATVGCGGLFDIKGSNPNADIIGLRGSADYAGWGNRRVQGLLFYAYNSGTADTIAGMDLIKVLASYTSATAVPAEMKGIDISTFGAGAKPLTAWGIHVQNLQATITAYGIKVDEQSGTNNYLAQFGNTSVNLRIISGAPEAGKSNMIVNLGGTLKQVSEYNADSAGVGYRALRVPN